MWTRIAAGVAVLALVVVAAVFLLGDGGSLLPGGDDETSSAFSFDLRVVRAAPISDRSPTQLQDEAEEAAEAVKDTMDHLYFSAFVDEGAWGSYDDAFALFLGPAADGARDDTEALTLGSTAGDDYDSLSDPSGTLHVVVLTNARDVAVSAVARVAFRARATLAEGGSTRVTSRGAFFLRPGADGWRIFAYDIDRGEEERAQGSPTTEATP